jgi:hypothetical protein
MAMHLPCSVALHDQGMQIEFQYSQATFLYSTDIMVLGTTPLKSHWSTQGIPKPS